MLAVETILGALTGYFTNDIAIRQLFAKNGMVVREREQFTTLIVQVLKDKIIDAETMATLCDRPEMVSFFETFVHELLGEAMPSALEGHCLADYDSDGALRRLVDVQLQAAFLDDATLDASRLYDSVDRLINGEAFQEALQETMKRMAALTPKALGVTDWLDARLAPFLAMDDEAWQSWLEEKSLQMTQAVDARDVSQSDDEAQTMQAFLSVDGEAIVQKAEAYFGLDWSETALLHQVVSYYTQFLEQLYVFAARVLPEVLEQHLPALIEAFYPMIVADREWLEQMVVESIDECNSDGNMVLSAASGYVQQFFAPDEDGVDWLTKLHEKLENPEENAVLCGKLADFLCGLVMRQIDEWRRLDFESEDGVQRVRAAVLRVRTLLVKGLDAYLSMPVHGNAVHRALEKGVIAVFFAWMRKHVDAALLHEWCDKVLYDWGERSLDELFFSEARQQALVGVLTAWWREEGAAWLSAHPIDGAVLTEGLRQAFDWLFAQPLAELMSRVDDALPYDQLGDALRGAFFGHLRDFLATLTQEQLDALTHEEIREVVLDMLGREMRPLAYLGGGIGAVAGVATGVAMQASGVTVDPDQMALLMAARSGMYGAVGYGTNVMAVKGLFWPYKKTLGLQGLICKNQQRFAKKMKSMAESYIINDEIWMQQVNHVAERFSDHYEDIIHQALHIMKEHRVQLLRPVTDEAMHQLPHFACRVVFEEKQVAAFMTDMHEKGIDACCKGKAVTAFAKRLHLVHRGICKLAMTEAANSNVSEKVIHELQAVTDEAWLNAGNALLAHGRFPTEVAFYQKQWQKVLPYYQTLPELLLKHREELSKTVGQFVLKRLSFPLQLAYRMAGGDHYIARVVEHFLEYKLPDYVAVREAQVQDALVGWAMAQLAGRSVYECGVTFSAAQSQWMLEAVQALSVERLHQELLRLLVVVEQTPDTLINRVIDALSDGLAPLWQWCREQLITTEADTVIHVNEVTRAMAPLLEILREEGFKDVGMADLLATDQGRLWQWVETVLDLSEAQKMVLIDTTHRIWLEVAPIFWGIIGQRGRELLMMVDVPTLTYDRICALSPQELEGMVRAIAQPYFIRVERMGWLGAVVAVPATLISMMLGGM